MILTRDKKFYKTLFLLSLPIALQNLITFLVGLCDNLMIGRLGDAAVSGVYMASQVQTVLQLISGGVEGAILVLSAQYWGRGDTKSIRRICAIGIRISLVIGAVFTAVSAIFPKSVLSLFTDKGEVISEGVKYLPMVAFSFVFFCITQALIAAMRSVEVARVGLYVSSISLGVNILLNYVLIFGKLGFPELGILGAAIATLIARVVELLIISLYVLLIDKRLRFKLSDLFKTDRELLRDFVKYGAPIIAGQLVWAVNMFANAAIMGRQSADGVVAGLSIANTLHSLTYVIMNGMSSAVGIITGKTVGEGREEAMREYAKTVQVLFLILGILTGGAVLLLKSPFISLYNVTEAAARAADSLINVVCVSVIGTCYQAACLFGLVKSGGDTGFVFKNDLIFVFGVVIPSALIASYLGAPAWVVFACLKCDQILKCFVAVVKINRFDWMKNLTREVREA